MAKLKKLCLLLAGLLLFSSVYACDTGDAPLSSETSSSSTERPTLTPQQIVDLAYALGLGESLEGTYTLTGKVTAVNPDGKNKTITILVENRHDKPILCYGISGDISTLKVGDSATVRGSLTNYDDNGSSLIEFDKGCVLLSFFPAVDDSKPAPPTDDPYVNVTQSQFYSNYSPATSHEDAVYRSTHGLMSGTLTVPNEAPTLAASRPKQNGLYIRNSEMRYSENGNAYTVVDCYGNDAFTVYKGGGYITLEEVAAYVYAFGYYPANYISNKSGKPTSHAWGKYLRLNHSYFSGDTDRYPFEPVLPNISGCGGDLQYFEMDIGTTGTTCDPNYPAELYNDGASITRGAARIVYGKVDLNNDGVYQVGGNNSEFHLFYTYNHYNDFQEYLNYQGGWGQIFGNITGGGAISSKNDYNPTPYVNIVYQPLFSRQRSVSSPLEGYKSLILEYSA